MKFDLSSEITLEMLPERYYQATDAIESLRQRRFEKLKTNIYKSQKDASLFVAKKIAALIREKGSAGKPCALGLSGGTSPLAVYDELVRLHKEDNLSFEHVIVFNVSEFFPLYNDRMHSNGKILRHYLIDKVNIKPENFITPDSSVDKNNVYDYCRNYEEEIRACGGLDLVLLSVGSVGNIAYNEPGSQTGMPTRLMLLDHESRSDLARFYSSADEVPDSAITIGLSTILEAAEVVLLAWGEKKAAILKEIIQGNVTDSIPASFLQLHKNAVATLDLGAAQSLTRLSQPWLVGTCEWTNKLVRKAIVWLCEQTGKPILKLTNKDYNQHGLSELLSHYGSAYDVNIRIFNDLQHTITGWPGGKPNADDTNRPERALPYPKRVLVFSPHPDDDVISMGGTLQRLVDQQHNVHVAYQTSGNIAVGDEDAIRTLSLMLHLNELMEGKAGVLDAKCKEALDFLTHKKKNGDYDTADVLFLKTQIRKEEARAACRYIGIKEDNIHFLGLPFYETGRIQKDKLSEKDVQKIIPLLQEIKPHQIYLAGDLADPHGTHKVCLDAALSAIYEVRNEAWMKDCRIWMYRGAWAEWEIDHIEMAVPISPEELRRKRNSILKHQSQMESAPFLGNDERLFWQRSEDRNHATAELYRNLGLASYEAIEAFVEYKLNG
ncbi:MAG: glucosamine-6-phosphate deaminase [Prevotella sp.]|jgi:glucosamine-6-phosphate deaminase|nr:glucosamine-6-phosphate deaminase [Prevotella sp.]